MRRVVAILAAASAIAACDSSQSGSSSRLPLTVFAGCGATRLHRGAVPAWTASAWTSSSGPPAALPYALTAHGIAAAFIFGYPLRAGDPSNPTNKILWIVRLPRHGAELLIRARPLHAPGPVVTVRRPADSAPGEIYPSIVNVPRAGCWKLRVRWHDHVDTLDLAYRA